MHNPRMPESMNTKSDFALFLSREIKMITIKIKRKGIMFLMNWYIFGISITEGIVIIARIIIANRLP